MKIFQGRGGAESPSGRCRATPVLLAEFLDDLRLLKLHVICVPVCWRIKSDDNPEASQNSGGWALPNPEMPLHVAPECLIITADLSSV